MPILISVLFSRFHELTIETIYRCPTFTSLKTGQNVIRFKGFSFIWIAVCLKSSLQQIIPTFAKRYSFLTMLSFYLCIVVEHPVLAMPQHDSQQSRPLYGKADLRSHPLKNWRRPHHGYREEKLREELNQLLQRYKENFMISQDTISSDIQTDPIMAAIMHYRLRDLRLRISQKSTSERHIPRIPKEAEEAFSALFIQPSQQEINKTDSPVRSVADKMDALLNHFFSGKLLESGAIYPSIPYHDGGKFFNRDVIKPLWKYIHNAISIPNFTAKSRKKGNRLDQYFQSFHGKLTTEMMGIAQAVDSIDEDILKQGSPAEVSAHLDRLNRELNRVIVGAYITGEIGNHALDAIHEITERSNYDIVSAETGGPFFLDSTKNEISKLKGMYTTMQRYLDDMQATVDNKDTTFRLETDKRIAQLDNLKNGIRGIFMRLATTGNVFLSLGDIRLQHARPDIIADKKHE